MHNTFKVFTRDLRRLLATPAALIIIVGITVLPALYSWVNIYGFWDPYGHTNAITISVANEDKGGSNPMTGELNAGDNIVEALKGNDQLGWRFRSHDEALQDVQSGDSYAAFIIPQDFTADLLTILTSDFQEPQLEYYVNEKVSAIAPRVTDTGATTVDEQINDTFVATVAKVVSDKLSGAFAQANSKLNDADETATAALRAAVGKVDTAQGKLTDLSSDIDSQHGKIATVRTTIGQLSDEAKNLNTQVSSIVSTADSTRLSLSSFALGLAAPLDTASSSITTAAGTASLTMQSANGTYARMNGQISTGIDTAQSLADAQQSLIDTLSNSPLASRQTVKDQISRLQSEHDKTQSQLDALKQMQQDATNTMNDTTALVTNLSNDTTSAVTSLDAMRSQLTGTTLPSINSSFSTLNSALNSMSALATSQSREIAQINTILDQLDATLTQMQSVLSTTNNALGTLKTDLDTAATDVGLLANSTTWHNIMNAMNLDSGKISDFMSSPTKIETEKLYPVETYGSAMAALFTSLTMWIGGLACVIILRTDADDEGVPGMTIRQGFMGRFMLMSVVSVLQAITVSVGEVVLKVQMVNVPLFFFTSVIVGLIFLAFIYSLSVCFAHIGVGLAMVVAFLQIPGSSGLYPIEMMPSFFQRIYPLLPFTYSISMYRECIAGFYRNSYWMDLAKLTVFALVAFVLGLMIRPYMTNLTRVFNREALESHLVVADETPTVARRYRLMQLIRALGSSETYRTDVMLSATRYELRYPKLKRGALVAGFVIPAILAILSHYNTGNKPLVIALWVGWMIIIIVFLLVIDLIRDSFQRQMLLLKVSPDELRRMLREHRSTILGKLQIANTTPSPLPRDEEQQTQSPESTQDDDTAQGDGMAHGTSIEHGTGTAHNDAMAHTATIGNAATNSAEADIAHKPDTRMTNAVPAYATSADSDAQTQPLRPIAVSDSETEDSDTGSDTSDASNAGTAPKHGSDSATGADAVAASLAAPLEKLSEAIAQRKDSLQLRQDLEWEDNLIARFTEPPIDTNDENAPQTHTGQPDVEATQSPKPLSTTEEEARTAMKKRAAVRELARSLDPSLAQTASLPPITGTTAPATDAPAASTPETHMATAAPAASAAPTASAAPAASDAPATPATTTSPTTPADGAATPSDGAADTDDNQGREGAQ
ncbi:YhgE/Pip domain-containing protein [Pseudoscardovia suis]|uniref:ABC-2 type transporter n=1 Tax=Pseudoscardovia suis TaxID=987063 RepID=A0A261EYL7_9BIFI|nr:YhgE/Pip domain-containing protein [Pseudoscardovia suis]OZG51959.1 ABC-2 type transporter [Pseudoscardovia suis]PJJ69443.1 putative membrane protein [Pseudoscardovia suis]